MKTTTGLLVVLGAAMLVGCGSEEAAPTPAAPAAPTAETVLGKADPVAKMARAVSTAKTGAAVDLRYEVLAKPVVGTPFDIEISLVATAEADSMSIQIGGMPGLTVSNEALPVLANIKAGQVNSHKITVLADQVGVYYVSVAVTTQLAGTTQARTFSIPVLLGDPNAVQKTAVAPPKDATGQAIQSMPAKENKGK